MSAAESQGTRKVLISIAGTPQHDYLLRLFRQRVELPAPPSLSLRAISSEISSSRIASQRFTFRASVL